MQVNKTPSFTHAKYNWQISFYTQTPVNLLMEMHNTKHRMANPILSCMPAKDYQKP